MVFFINISIIVTDTLASTAVVLQVKVCDCQNGGSCNYNISVEGSDLVNDKFEVVTCDCPPGYTGDFCQDDYDACADNPCFPGVNCTDDKAPSIGFECGECPTGLIGNGTKCFDFDECEEERDFDSSEPFCDQICENTLRSYVCHCSEGYRLDADEKGCRDINECTENIDDCHQKATCINIGGGFNCTCNDGYIGVDSNRTLCEDVNECLQEPCGENTDCTNIVGSYKCTCLDGYEFDSGGFNCSDVNECERHTDNCSPQSTCTNTIGSFDCHCNAGWTGNGVNCSDVKECSDITMNNCHVKRATCTELEGSYSCACKPGYIGDGITCEDMDECDTGQHNCEVEGSKCVNKVGSYICVCTDGYTGNGTSCSDVNECAENSTYSCSDYALCENIPGSYQCICKSGFLEMARHALISMSVLVMDNLIAMKTPPALTRLVVFNASVILDTPAMEHIVKILMNAIWIFVNRTAQTKRVLTGVPADRATYLIPMELTVIVRYTDNMR
ncbi:fibrillin-2-like [Ptychodera flava]|uniref:fibrillin-2-like n=1 Tax=Ptychodera flava TaxID=63121 RepID=UPI00396A0083